FLLYRSLSPARARGGGEGGKRKRKGERWGVGRRGRRRSPGGGGEGSKRGEHEGVADLGEFGGEAFVQAAAGGGGLGGVHEVGHFKGVVAEVEEEPGGLGRAGVFPAVAGDEGAVGGGFLAGFDGLDERAVGHVGGRGAALADEAVVVAFHPVGHGQTAEAERGGGDVHVVDEHVLVFGGVAAAGEVFV